ncbi:MAG TPA: hypothetical protein VGC04_13940 [Cellulomonas sp.]
MAVRVPVAVRVACALVWLQAVVAAVAAGALVVVLVRGAQMPGASAALAVIALGVAAALVGASVALLRGGHRWARSPVLTVQFLVGALAVAGWTTAPAPWPAVALALALAVVASLLTRAAVAWTVPGRPTSED